MKRFDACLIVGSLCALTACATVGTRLPRTMGERESAFGYVPLDGLGIVERPDPSSCYRERGKKAATYRPLLEALPDLSVRFAVASFSADGGLTFGPAKVTAKGATYRAVLDYVNVDVIPVPFLVRKTVESASGYRYRKLSEPNAEDEETVAYEAVIDTIQQHVYLIMSDSAEVAKLRKEREEMTGKYDQITVPVYVGLGMRLSADIRALKSDIALSSLGSIAAEAQANALSGTLTVQTLGITGKSVATALPLPSKLDQTTVENGILALGSSRSILYSGGAGNGEVTKTARLVGLYSPVDSDPRLINAMYSELSRIPPIWRRVCVPEAEVDSAP